MRVLHAIERDARPGHVVVATADGLEQFELEIDDALRAVLNPAKPAAGHEPKIGPREIQVRVRAGESPAELAAAYDADPDWVQRFAGPVLAERERVADEARRAKARRTDGDGQTVIFGETVDARYARHGIDPGTVRWDAYRREDAQWVITASWIGGQSEHTAQWNLHLSARTVAPLDEAAADLLSDRPIRPVEEVVPDTVPDSLVTFPAMPDAHTGPLPRPVEDVFDQSRYDQPLPIPGLRNLGVANREPTDEERAARATIPSWDEILLGVRRKQD